MTAAGGFNVSCILEHANKLRFVMLLAEENLICLFPNIHFSIFVAGYEYFIQKSLNYIDKALEA